MITPGFNIDSKANTLFRLQADNQLIGCLKSTGCFKYRMRNGAKVDDYFSHFIGHPFTGSEVERNTFPTPGRDLGTYRNKGFGVAVVRDVIGIQVTADLSITKCTGAVLTTDCILKRIKTNQWFQGT